MKKYLLSLILLVILIVGYMSVSAADGEVTTWRLNQPMPNDSACGYMGQKFADKVKELSNGRYVIEVFPNEQLAGGGGGSEAVQMVQTGMIDFDIHNGTMWQGYEPKLDVVSSPFLFRSRDAVESAKSLGLLEYLGDLYNGIGMKALGFGESGWSYWASRKGFFDSMESMKGVKMRSPNESYSNAFSALGMNPAYATSNEVITSLQQNVLDAAPYQIMFLYAQSVPEVAPYVTKGHFIYDFLTLTMNLELYNSLSEEDQALLDEAGAYAEKELTAYLDVQNEWMLDDMANKFGAQYYNMTEELEEECFNALKDLYKKKVELLDCDDLFEICGLDFEWLNK